MAIKVKIRNRLQPVGGQVADPGFARRQWAPLGALGQGITDLGQSIAKISRGIESSKKALVVDQAEVAAIKAAQDAEIKAEADAKLQGIRPTEAFENLIGDKKSEYLANVTEYGEYANVAFDRKILDARSRMALKDKAMEIREVQEKITGMYAQETSTIRQTPERFEEISSKLESKIQPHVQSGLLTEKGAKQIQELAYKDAVTSAVYGYAEQGNLTSALEMITEHADIIDKDAAVVEAKKLAQQYISNATSKIVLQDKEDGNRYRTNFDQINRSITKGLADAKTITEVEELGKIINSGIMEGSLNYSGQTKFLQGSAPRIREIDSFHASSVVEEWLTTEKSKSHMISKVRDMELAKGQLTHTTAERLMKMFENESSRTKFPTEDRSAALALARAQTQTEKGMFESLAPDEKPIRALQYAEILAKYSEELQNNPPSATAAMRKVILEVMSSKDMRTYIPKLPVDEQMNIEGFDGSSAIKSINSRLKTGDITEKQALQMTKDAVNYSTRKQLQDDVKNLKDTGYKSLYDYINTPQIQIPLRGN